MVDLSSSLCQISREYRDPSPHFYQVPMKKNAPAHPWRVGRHILCESQDKIQMWDVNSTIFMCIYIIYIIHIDMWERVPKQRCALETSSNSHIRWIFIPPSFISVVWSIQNPSSKMRICSLQSLTVAGFEPLATDHFGLLLQLYHCQF